MGFNLTNSPNHRYSVKSLFEVLLSVVVVVFLAYSALLHTEAALITVKVPSGNYVIPAGKTQEGVLIELFDPLGSVVMEPGSKLKNSQVRCETPHHTAPGVIVAGDDVTLEKVRVGINGPCGSGVNVMGVSRFHFWQGEVKNSRGRGIVLDLANDSDLFGVWVAASGSEGIFLRASNRNQIVATLVYVGTAQRGLVLDVDSHQNQIVRSRTRYNKGIMQADAADNLFYHSVCGMRVGYVGCLTDDGSEPRNWNDPAAFLPRWRTACKPQTFQRSACDFLAPQDALGNANNGERIVVDTNGTAGWGSVTIGTDGILLLGNELTMQGRYNYINYLDVLSVLSPGVHVQNFEVRSTPLVQPDTILTAVSYPP